MRTVLKGARLGLQLEDVDGTSDVEGFIGVQVHGLPRAGEEF